jgi:hypothetical protein
MNPALFGKILACQTNLRRDSHCARCGAAGALSLYRASGARRDAITEAMRRGLGRRPGRVRRLGG